MCMVRGGGGAAVCELDTVHIHWMAASNRVLKLAICNMHLLFCAVQAGLDVSDPKPSEISGVDAD